MTASTATDRSAVGAGATGHRVVVGVDASPASSAALDWAVAESARRQVPLHIVHTWKWQHLAPWETAADRMVESDLVRAGHRLISRCRAAAAQQEPDLTVTDEVRQGRSGQVLVDLSREADLVVLGTHHLRALGRAVVGSTSSVLATYAACPVLVVSSVKRSAVSSAPGPHTVVLGLCGASTDAAVLDFGFRYAQLHSLPVRAVYAWRPGEAADSALPPPQEAFSWLQRSVASCRADYPDLLVETTVRRGHPVSVLMETSEPNDLIVVGRSTRSGFRAHLGSVGLGLLHQAPGSVAVVPTSSTIPTATALPSRTETDMTTTDTESLTAQDLVLVHNALESYLSDFGHDEAELVEQIRAVSAKVSRALATERDSAPADE